MPQTPDTEPVDIEGILAEIRRKTREEFYGSDAPGELRAEVQNLMDNSRLGQERVISSQRPFAGRLFVWIRNLLYGEIRRSVDPALEKQSDWNLRASRILLRQQEEIDRLRRELAEARGEATFRPGNGARDETAESAVGES